MPVLPVKAKDLPKTNIVPEMTALVRIAKAEYRDVESLKAEGKIKAESALVSGVNLDLVIQDEGEFFGRHIFDGVDLEGQFAHRFRQLLDALEYPEDQDVDTDLLQDGEFIAVIGIQKESKDGQYPERNRVKKFLPVDAQVERGLKEAVGV